MEAVIEVHFVNCGQIDYDIDLETLKFMTAIPEFEIAVNDWLLKVGDKDVRNLTQGEIEALLINDIVDGHGKEANITVVKGSCQSLQFGDGREVRCVKFVHSFEEIRCEISRFGAYLH